MSWENMVLNQSNAVESPSLKCLANPLYCPLADHSVSNKTAIKCKVRLEWSRVYKHTGNENCKPVETGVKSGKHGEKSRSVTSKEKYKTGVCGHSCLGRNRWEKSQFLCLNVVMMLVTRAARPLRAHSCPVHILCTSLSRPGSGACTRSHRTVGGSPWGQHQFCAVLQVTVIFPFKRWNTPSSFVSPHFLKTITSVNNEYNIHSHLHHL